MASLRTILQTPEPSNYAHANLHPEWLMVMKLELEALEKNGTWQLTTLHAAKKTLTPKWVYRTKFRPDGLVLRYKARLVT